MQSSEPDTLGPLIVKGTITKDLAHQLVITKDPEHQLDTTEDLSISAVLDPKRAQLVLIASNDKTKKAAIIGAKTETDVRPYLGGRGGGGGCVDPQTKPFMISMIVFLVLMVLGWLLFGLKMGNVL